MRPRLSAGLLVLGAVPALLALPTVTSPAPSPHPVPARLAAVSLPLSPAARRALDAPRAVRAVHAPLVDTGRRATARFSLVAASWLPGTGVPGLQVRVRVRTDGRWGGWTQLPPSDALPTGTDAGRRPLRAGTDPVVTDPSDGVEAQVSSPSGELPDDLRLDLVDPGSSSADAHLQPARPAASAAADATMPAVIPRAQWGADESYRGGTPRYSATIKAAIIHHTASTTGYSADEAAAQLRAIYAYHTRTLGWSDIGYNFLVDRFGRIYEGRAGGRDRNVIGAHTAGYNLFTTSVSALGNYDSSDAPSPMTDAIARILAWRLSVAKLDPRGTAQLTASGGTPSLTRFGNGTTVTMPTILGHRDVGLTACPGRYLYADLPAIRREVATLMGPMIFSPAVTSTSFGVAEGGTITLSARSDAPRPWSVTVTSASTGGTVRSFSGSGSAISATWDGRDTAGAQLEPGGYDLTLASPPALPWTVRLTAQAPAPPTPEPSPQPGPLDHPTPSGPPPLPPIDAVYTTDSGARSVNGRQWRTRCESYGPTSVRCWTEIVASGIVPTAHGYANVTGWRPNSLTYRGWDGAAWAGNLLATPGIHWSAGRRWQTTCTTGTPGWRSCRSWIWASAITRTATTTGFRYASVQSWHLADMVWLKQ